MDAHLTVVDHPLIKHKLTLMRRSTASTQKFRSLLREVAHLLTYEITRDLELTTEEIEKGETIHAGIMKRFVFQVGQPDHIKQAFEDATGIKQED